MDRQSENTIVALSIEESAIAQQLDAAEKKGALLCCPEYCSSNIYWKRTDVLIERQDSIMEEIRNYNLQKSTKTKPAEHSVSDFFNEPNPLKSTNNKRPAEVHEVGSSNENNSIDSIGSNSK